ncbi:MAG TPA: hypothetical protein H9768_01785 [Candidatus Mailhella merdavium]|nr:hypothetical protein [Candidatus Mailhella merdavium]
MDSSIKLKEGEFEVLGDAAPELVNVLKDCISKLSGHNIVILILGVLVINSLKKLGSEYLQLKFQTPQPSPRPICPSPSLPNPL